MVVLGLNAYAHDAGVAVVENGRPVVVVEEERLNRERKTAAFPVQGIAYLRDRLGLRLDDVDAVAFPWRGGRLVWTVGKLVLRRFPGALNLLRHGASPMMSFPTALRLRRAGPDLARAFRHAGPIRVRSVAHHLAHAACALHLSPFEHAAIIVMDGFGDECSTSVYHADGTALRQVRTN